MPAQMKVLGRVLVRRGIATAYVPTFGATPQVQPPSAARQTLDTTGSGWFNSGIDTPRVPVFLFHPARRS
jgi:hypothetical protein